MPHPSHHKEAPNVVLHLNKIDHGWGDSLRFSSLPLVAQELANTSAFRRLLGVGHAGFDALAPGGEVYSRALHALVATAVTHRILGNPNNVPGAIRFTPEELVVGALFHDIGHHAFSHSAEHAFSSLDHKRNGEDILFNDPEIQQILLKYELDVHRVLLAGLAKVEGNPFSLKRSEGHLSLDHLANLVTDLRMRTAMRFHPRLIERLFELLYINEQGKLALPEKEVALATEMLKWTIAQNEAIFGARSKLNDILGEEALRLLSKAGCLSAEDMTYDHDVIRIMGHHDTPPLVSEIRFAIERVIPALRDAQLPNLIRPGMVGPSVLGSDQGGSGDYLLLPMLGEKDALSVLGEVARRQFLAARERIALGSSVDVEAVLRSNGIYRRARYGGYPKSPHPC